MYLNALLKMLSRPRLYSSRYWYIDNATTATGISCPSIQPCSHHTSNLSWPHDNPQPKITFMTLHYPERSLPIRFAAKRGRRRWRCHFAAFGHVIRKRLIYQRYVFFYNRRCDTNQTRVKKCCFTDAPLWKWHIYSQTNQSRNKLSSGF